MVIGASGSDGDTALIPRMFNELFGTRFKVISGYPGMTEAIIAMERNEVHGIMANGWGGPTTEAMVQLHRTGPARIIVQLALEPKPEMPGVPLPMDFVTRDEDRPIVETVLSRMELGRPFFAPPGIPADRLAMLREAFDKAAADPELRRRGAADAALRQSDDRRAVAGDDRAHPRDAAGRSSTASARCSACRNSGATPRRHDRRRARVMATRRTAVMVSGASAPGVMPG